MAFDTRLGLAGGGTPDGADPMARVNAMIEDKGGIQKNDTGDTVTLSKAQQVEQFFAENEEAYAEYMAARTQR